MTENPYNPPTQAELDAAQARYHETQKAYDELTKASLAAGEEYQAAGWEWIRLQALSMPVRNYIVDKFTRYTFTRKVTAKVIAPHHDPAEVVKVLADLEAEGLIRRDARRGYVPLFEGDRP